MTIPRWFLYLGHPAGLRANSHQRCGGKLLQFLCVRPGGCFILPTIVHHFRPFEPEGNSSIFAGKSRIFRLVQRRSKRLEVFETFSVRNVASGAMNSFFSWGFHRIHGLETRQTASSWVVVWEDDRSA